MNPDIQKLQDQITRLEQDLKALNDEVYKNNFSARQDFNKASSFTSKLKVPHYSSDPTTAEVGEIIEVGGKLKICSSANTFVVAGTQS